MKNIKLKDLFPLTLLLAWGTAMPAEGALNITGEARVRGESKVNANYQGISADRKSFTASRFRLNFSAKPDNSKIIVFIQPQFTKIWGQVDDSSIATSGNLNDTRLDVHQAYMDIDLAGSFTLRMGRQEFNLGDQLVIGGVGWHNIGRSFDAISFNYTIADNHKLSAIASKIIDNNITAAAIGDFNFYGLYYAADLGEYFKNLDLYILDKSDHRPAKNSDIYTFGIRAKSNVNQLDYRLEYNTQNGRVVGSEKKNNEGQFDIEVGYSFETIKSRIGFEYFSSTEQYDQMMPTGHKWLGFADQFSRRNIKGYVIHLNNNSLESITFMLDYHLIERTKTDQPAYSFGGASLGTTGASRKIASEIDITLKYKIDDSLSLSFGHSFVAPGAYLKDQSASNRDKTQWSYFQLLAKF